MTDAQFYDHDVVGETERGQVTVAFYDDGDVVVQHGSHGIVKEMADSSGYDPILNALDVLDVPQDLHDDVLDRVESELGGSD